MTFTVAPALFFGLGARILLEKLFRPRSSYTGDYVFSGVWQGVGLYYVLMELPHWALAPALIIGAKLVFEFTVLDLDLTKCALTLLGVALGVLFTDVLSQLVEDGPSDVKRGSSSTHKHRSRLLPFGRNDGRETGNRDRGRREASRRERRLSITAPPSISLDSTSSTIDPHGTMSPLERQVAELRARASLADTERRRFKEEKKWALSQGNKARASQMGWQVKRYAALMESFNREADEKLIQAARLRGRDSRPQGRHVELPNGDLFVSINNGNRRKVGAVRPDIRFVEVRDDEREQIIRYYCFTAAFRDITFVGHLCVPVHPRLPQDHRAFLPMDEPLLS